MNMLIIPMRVRNRADMKVPTMFTMFCKVGIEFFTAFVANIRATDNPITTLECPR